MSILATATKGRVESPVRGVLFGVEKIGKSTFASNAPNPIFIDVEKGTGFIDTTRVQPTTWEDIMEVVKELTATDHEFKTLVLDSLDWAERLLWARVCKKAKAENIETAFGGYGKGFTAAIDEWRAFLYAIEELIAKKKMNVILVAHAHIKPFNNPEGDNFDRYEMKLNAKAAGLLKEWAHAVLFANYEILTAKNDKKQIKGVDSEARIIHTRRTAAYDAGNRYSLPETLPLSWDDFYRFVTTKLSPDEIITAIQETFPLLNQADLTAATGALERCNKDGTKLVQLHNWVNTKAAQAAKEKV